MKVITELWIRDRGDKKQHGIDDELASRSAGGWRLVAAYATTRGGLKLGEPGGGYEGLHFLYFEKVIEP